MAFESAHWPLEDYVGRLADGGFLGERLREPALPDGASLEPRGARWQRVPLFLNLRAIRG